MFDISLKKYINIYTEKYIKAIIKHFSHDCIVNILFFLPIKYLTYKEGCIDEDFQDHIPVIYGQVTHIYKKTHITFISLIDLNHKDKKKFSIYFKNKKNIGIKVGLNYYLIGKITKKEDNFCIFFPQYQTTKWHVWIIPIYNKILGCPQEKLRLILSQIIKTLPHHYIFSTNNLCKYSLCKALSMLHNTFQSNDIDQIKIGWSYLKMCEYLCFFDGVYRIQNNNLSDSKPINYKFNLPMALTVCQKNAIINLYKNLDSTKVTTSFLQGDVASGKTLVAFCCINKTLLNNFNSCMMCPTIILAFQHYTNYKKLFPHFNSFLIQSGYKSKKYLEELHNLLLSKIPTVFFGTHGLLFEQLLNISFIVIDEQHKFGMEQRKTLMDKYPTSDVLFLSATPIPRTLFMLKINQMQLYTLKTIPFIKQIKTIIIKNKLEILDKIYLLSKTNKILWINATINNTEDFNKISVNNTYNFFLEKNIETYLLHGQLKDEEKLNILNNFQKGILVATICVETGMHIPGLNMIIIENAANFGLATLHQLRGRVGREGEFAECILIEEKNSEKLEVLINNNDGFSIAEMDLKQRGAGNFFQKQQWGLSEFKTGKLNNRLFELSSLVFQERKYLAPMIQNMSKFFFKLQDVNY
jgi:RecG-like helicase